MLFRSLTLQSLSTTRTEYCGVDVTHTAATAVPTQRTVPTLRVNPEIVTLSLIGQVKATLTGENFTPGGGIDIQVKPPNHPVLTGIAQAGTDGNFEFEMRIGPQMPKGTWHVTATDRVTGVAAEADFTVR